MIQMQKADLILFLSQNEEDGVQQLDDLAHVVQPNCTCHLRIYGNEKAYFIPKNHLDTTIDFRQISNENDLQKIGGVSLDVNLSQKNVHFV